MPLRLPVDTKALVINYLKAHASVSALVGSRVSGRAGSVFPQVTVGIYGGREVVAPRDTTHLDETYVQVDCWGEHYNNSEQATNLLARTVYAAIREMPNSAYSRGVVTRTRVISPPREFDDEAGRSRWLAEYGIFTHPLL